MNTKIKVAIGVLAGLVAGTMLMGSAFALPAIARTATYPGYGMMRSFETSGSQARAAFTDMWSFMNRYRAPNGGIDIARMRSDVSSGRVTPPCLTYPTNPTTTTPSTPGSPRPNAGYGYGMMGGFYQR